ncbi:Pre-mRNA-splicing factor of RES complex-domain-containing protein [Catenaria anguillulae PL171]|uniref:Pre-mRNA-splicing factor of RES complex-domain-containing protein n=1 Tax=Catenaria anguillulae PL171 TaxID=765915 RepID=A0A1Y2HVQ1_9FUNG|nr:Pre-mRNA-splicing factor of RES complex-domain-containing protein [Catenaria anguillulae PL171]
MTSKSKADYLAKYLSDDPKKKKKKSSKSSSLVIDQDDSIMIAPPPAARSIDPQVTIRTASSSSFSSSGAHAPHDPIPLPTIDPVNNTDDGPINHGVNTVVIPKLARPRARHDSDSDADDDDGPPRRRMRYDSDSDDDRGGRGDRPPRDDPAQQSQAPGGTTVHRDARGRKVAVADLRQEAAAAEQAQVDKMNKDKLFMMGRVQLEQMREKRRQLLEGREAGPGESSGSAAAASVDPLKDRMRWGDPGAMLGLVEKQKAKMRDPDRPQYEGGWAPNRFMIPPGFRWDGIDRSNGFERKLLMRQNERAADEEAKYKWRSEDM